MKCIFEKELDGVRGYQVPTEGITSTPAIPKELLRQKPPALPNLPEGEVVRHYTALSRLNYSVDTHFYPLGSCTMKYNPKAAEYVSQLPGFTDLHPILPLLPGGDEHVNGALAILFETERLLAKITGMAEFTLQPSAGAHGELTGVMIMAAYHRDRKNNKTQIIIPDSAHGTNPASAALAGYEVVTVPSDKDGNMDFAQFRSALNENTAGVMMTCPNTMGVFDTRVADIAAAVHTVDGLMYYDGANLNAIMGRCKPAEMGFDVCHLNLHKTFATPHGGGGPGAGPVGVVEKLRPYLPVPRIQQKSTTGYYLNQHEPKSIGAIAPFYGNFAVILRAYAYILMLGQEGLKEASDLAVLNANYILHHLRQHLQPALDRTCMHECVFSGRSLLKNKVHTLDIAKALIDRGIHPPTIYFPLNVPEALMIEPTETESKETLDHFITIMIELIKLAETNPAALHAAPITTPVGRLDEVAAARDMDLAKV